MNNEEMQCSSLIRYIPVHSGGWGSGRPDQPRIGPWAYDG